MAKLDNSEVEIANIIQSGNFDELKNLQKQIRQDLKDNPKDSAVHLFAQVFIWSVFEFYKNLSNDDKIIELRDKICDSLDKINLELKDTAPLLDALDMLDNYDRANRKEHPKKPNKKKYLSLINKLFAYRGDSYEIFWDIIKCKYGKDELDDLKFYNFYAVNELINESGLFNEDGRLDENITFEDLLLFAESKLLWLKFSDNLAIKYHRTMCEKLQNRGTK